MRSYSISIQLESALKKLQRKDKVRHEAALKKIKEVASSYDVQHYKNLQAPLQQFKRAHVDSHFVLVFKYIRLSDSLIFCDLDHHDKIYKKRYAA